MKIRIVIEKVLLTLIVFAGMVSCTRDISINSGSKVSEENYTLVKLEVSVPGNYVPETRALQPQNEDEISEIVVFSFEKGTGSNWDTELKYVSRSIDAPQSNGSKRQFTVELYSGEWDLWVVTNLESLMGDIRQQYGNVDIYSKEFIDIGLTKSDLQIGITKTLNTKWPVDPSDAGGIYRIPMWGMLDAVSIQTSSTDIVKTINLYRMLVKVDVEVQRTPDIQNPTLYPGISESQFKLIHVSLHNYNTVGRLIPDVTSDAGNWINNGGGAALRTSLPASPGNISGWQSENSLEWNQASDFTTANTALEGVIYTFEANAGTNNNNRPCIIIGGQYGGSNEITYYRADFVDNNKTYMNLLRNHKYRLIIRKVGGRGFSSIEEAYIAGPVNIEAEIIECNESTINDIVFDGQYMLGVNKGEFELSKEARTAADTDNKLKVRTNVPTGWTAVAKNDLAGTISVSNDGTTGNPWLRISPTSGNGSTDSGNEITIATDANNTASTRTAYIHIYASRLTYIVKVVQTTQQYQEELKLEIRDSQTNSEIHELIWVIEPDATPETKEFDLLWEPRSSLVYLYPSLWGNASGQFVFNNTSGFDVIPSTTSTVSGIGSKHYKIRPQTVTTNMLNTDPFYEKSSLIMLMTSDDTDIIAKTFLLRQVYYNMTTNVKTEGYDLNSQTETINIKANFSWKITSVSDPYNILQNGNSLKDQTGGNNITTGDNISFTMAAKDNSKGGNTATITFTNQSNHSTNNIVIKVMEDLSIYVGMFGGELKNNNGIWQFERELYIDEIDAYNGVTWVDAASKCTLPSYLPTQDQLMAIWVVHNSFENENKLTYNYWSATESDAIHAWSVNFTNGFTNRLAKTSGYKIRCVRED